MVHGATVAAGQPPRQASQEHIIRHLNVQDALQTIPGLGQGSIKGLCLRDGSRETVKQHPVVPAAGLHDHGHGDLIRHKEPFIHIFPGLESQRRTFGHILPEEIPGRYMGKTQTLLQALGLRSLAGAGRTQKYEIHAPKPEVPGRETDQVTTSGRDPGPPTVT